MLGQGKTGKLVAEVGAERGHGVHVLDVMENAGATALTPPFVAGFDVVIDFTTPEAVVQNMRACLATGANPTTTGWHDYEYTSTTTYTAANDAVSSNY